jgi:type VI protein secretion system component VasF
MSFSEVVDAVTSLSLEEQESLMEIIHRRMIEQGRQRILADIQEAHRDYRADQTQPASVDSIVKEILS